MDKKVVTKWCKENGILFVLIGVILVVFFKPFAYMIAEWRQRLYSSYTPGPFVPIVSAYIIWQKRKELMKATIKPTYWGMVIIVPSLVLHIFAQIGDFQRISIVCFITLLLGLLLITYGFQVTKQLSFAIVFLIFMVPMEFLDGSFGVPLRIIASKWAAGILDIIGFQVVRIGTQIDMVDIFSFDVAAPCSGLKSLVSLTALGFAFAYLTQAKIWKRSVLILAAIPIAIMANVLRVVMIGLVAATLGPDQALGFFHMFSGFFLFTFALIALTGLGRLLSWSPKNLLS